MIVILILSFLVIIHELGHFFAARKVGVRVEEFGIGYPPRLAKLFKWKETVFSLNWLPFGGFVKLSGDDAETFEGGVEGESEKTGHGNDASHLFYNKSKTGRIVIVLAGAATNILFGILIFSASYTIMGIPFQLNHPKIELVSENSPAKNAGIQVGDVILSMNSEEMRTSAQFIEKIQQFRGKTTEIAIERAGEKLEIRTYIRTEQETPSGEGSLGVRLSDIEFRYYPSWQMPFRGVVQGIKDSIEFARIIPGIFGKMIVDLVTTAKISSDVSGPIGIVHAAQQEQLGKQSLLTILNFAAVLSLNLGIMNVMPIPALDGGRAVFILLETFIGKVRRAKIEHYANNIGMAMLLTLIVLISVKDIWAIYVR